MDGCDVGRAKRELESLAYFFQVQRNYFPELESDRWALRVTRQFPILSAQPSGYRFLIARNTRRSTSSKWQDSLQEVRRNGRARPPLCARDDAIISKGPLRVRVVET